MNARELLIEHEWLTYMGNTFCPVCRAPKDMGHRKDCRLVALMNEPDEAERAPGWVATSEGEPDAFERWLIELEAYAELLQMAAPYRSEEYNMRMGERGALSDAREAYRRFRATGTPEHEDTRPTAGGRGRGDE